MRFALTLLDVMSAGVFAATLVQIARRRLFLRIPHAWLYASLAALFALDRIFLTGNVYASAIVAAVAVGATVTAIALSRAEPFGALLVAVPSLVILTIVLADAFDPLRDLIAPLLTIPAIAGAVRLLYLYRKRYRTA